MDKKNAYQNLYNTLNMIWHEKKYEYNTYTWITKCNNFDKATLIVVGALSKNSKWGLQYPT